MNNIFITFGTVIGIIMFLILGILMAVFSHKNKIKIITRTIVGRDTTETVEEKEEDLNPINISVTIFLFMYLFFEIYRLIQIQKCFTEEILIGR